MNPTCPACHAPMVEKQNFRTGQPFWGCSRYPSCKGTISFHENKAYGLKQTSNRAKVTGYIRGKSKRYYNKDRHFGDFDLDDEAYDEFSGGDPNDYGDW